MAGYIGSKSSVTLVDGYTEAEADAEFVAKTGDTMTGDLNLGANSLSLGANNANSPQILFENSDGVTGDAALSTYDDSSGTMLVMGSNFYINSSGSETRFNTSEESSAVMLNRNGDLNLLTGGTGATATTRLKIDSSGNVGIGITPSRQLHVNNASESNIRLQGGSDYAELRVKDADDAFSFHFGGAERMRIDSSGNVLVGLTSSTDNTGAGHRIRRDGLFTASRDGTASQATAGFNKVSTDGDIVHFNKSGVKVGSIGSVSNKLFIDSQGGNLLMSVSGNSVASFDSVRLYPLVDNSYDLGLGSYRFDDIFATNGTIQTSDFNEKQDIASLTSTEMLVGKRISALFKTFRWKDSVADKGDNARTHTGVIAQDVQAAFTAEGLDAGDYALFISDTWWTHDVDVPAVEAVAEVTDEDGNVTTEAVEAVDAYTRTDNYDTEAEAPEGATSKTRLGIRYPELLSFVAAYNEQRFASIEARLTALEA